MEQISVIFSKSSSLYGVFSWLIMWAEGTPYSHVSIRMTDDETGQIVYYQASHTFVNVMEEVEWLTQETIVDRFDFQVNQAVKDSLKAFAIANLGKPYGLLSILGLSYVQIMSWFRVKVNNPFRDEGQTFVCSQFAAALLEQCSDVSIPENINNITPKDMHILISSLPKVLT
jgi:hypothetical protein